MHGPLIIRPPVALALAVALAAALALVAAPALRLPLAAPTQPPGPALGALPLSFVPNRGQAPGAAQALAAGLGGALAFEPGGVSLALPAAAPLALRFRGASPAASISLVDRLPGQIHDYRGEPGRWREGMPTYASLTYTDLYPGVDLRYDGQGGRLKGTYTLVPHADPAAIAWGYDGAVGLGLDPASGDLLIELPGGGRLIERAPVAWQDLGARRVPVDVRFVVEGETVRFGLGAYDPARPLVIDPELVYGTYLGGRGADYGRGIAVDGQGNIYVAGDFFSPDFLGSETTTAGSKDVIVLKLSPSGGELLYGLFMGSADIDEALAIAVSRAGEAYVAVDAGAGFPMRNAYRPDEPEAGDGVLIKLDAQGRLVFSTCTYLGIWLSNSFTHRAVTLDPQGNAYVVGVARGQIALVKLPPDGRGPLLESFEAFGAFVRSSAVAVGGDGAIYITGTAQNGRLPATPDAFQEICGGRLNGDSDCGGDAFLAVLSPAGELRYASYLGGDREETGTGVGVDAAGNVVVVGTTFSPRFPVRNALQPTCPVDPSIDSCYYHGFVTKFAPGGRGLVYSTYLGSAERDGQEFITDVAVDPAGGAFIHGFTNSQGFPIKDAPQRDLTLSFCFGLSERVCFDAFVTRLAPDGRLDYSTFLGGRFDEYSGGIALGPDGSAYVVGYTEASNFPVTGGALQRERPGNTNFYVARLGAGSPIVDLRFKSYLPQLRR